MKYTLTTIDTRLEATQRVMAVKLTRLTHKVAIQLHLVTSCTICSSRSRRPGRKLSDSLSYGFFYGQELLAPPPNTQDGQQPLVGCPRLLIQYIRSYCPYLEAVSSIRLAAVTGTRITRYPFNLNPAANTLN
jgi:hypothetical protein